jgi:hypothetical protein
LDVAKSKLSTFRHLSFGCVGDDKSRTVVAVALTCGTRVERHGISSPGPLAPGA